MALKHGLVIVSDNHTMQLQMYSLSDGALVRSVGTKGKDKAQFHFPDYGGGLCVSPDGDSVLVADEDNHRVQQVQVVDGSWVRYVGAGIICLPGCVDCNDDAIATSSPLLCRIWVFGWADGSLRAWFGTHGWGKLEWPRGIRLLGDGSGLVVADGNSDRLSVFGLSGRFVKAFVDICAPRDVLECPLEKTYLSTATAGIVTISQDGKVIGAADIACNSVEEGLLFPDGLAAIPGQGYAVSLVAGRQARFGIVRDHLCRLQWLGICVVAALSLRSERLKVPRA